MHLYSFTYQGGSNPGTKRVVWGSKNSTHIEGLDLGENGWRRFLTSHVRGLQEIAFDSLDMKNVPVGYAVVIDAYKLKGKRAFYDTKTKHVISWTEPNAKPPIQYYANGFIFHHDGKYLQLRLHSNDDTVIILETGRRYKNMPSIQDVIKALQELIA